MADLEDLLHCAKNAETQTRIFSNWGCGQVGIMQNCTFLLPTFPQTKRAGWSAGPFRLPDGRRPAYTRLLCVQRALTPLSPFPI